MPLLNKNPFVPNEPPPDLSDSEEVFFCRLTREIFRDYEQFCDRIILCNSLVWSCSLTGRSHLTYQEAAASEEKIKRLLKRFPMELRIPVLFLASLCERKSLVELAEDVFSFVKDRFFTGETVYATLPGKGDKTESIQCHVLAVTPPTQEEIDKYEQENQKNGGRFNWVPPHLYTYDIERMDNGEELEVKGDQITRKKSAYTKDKNRLYIKQFVTMENGFWKLKESCNTKYGISKVKFDQIFCGEAPDMTVHHKPAVERKKAKRQETLNKYFVKSDKKVGIPPRKSPKKGDILDRRGIANAGKRKRRTKKEMEEALRLGNKLSPSMRAAIEAKRKMRQEAKEKKKSLADFYKEWSMKREDLECEDLKDLPVPTQVESRLPNAYVGDAIMLLEYFHAFRNLLPVKDFFPHGITFDLVERALVDKEIAGPLADILQLLLTSIFDLQEQEYEEIKETDVKITPGLIFTRGDADTLKVVKAATVSEALARRNHSVPLSQLSIDPTTISEVLRLHLLSSGSIPSKNKVAKWRYQARGGYCNNDDPGVVFKLRKPQLIEKLGQFSIFDFPAEEKIAVLNCLVEQIITYSSFRDIVEESCEKARLARIELRSVRAAEVKKEKEEALRLKAEKKNGIVAPPPPPPQTSSPSDEKKQKENRELRSLNPEKKGETIPDLLADIREALAGAQLAPLGTDSAFRRYWIFSSVPGLFVEGGEENPGPCIPNGTPMFSGPTGGTEEDSLNYIRKLFEESSKDKENLPGRGPPVGHLTPSKRHLSEKNGSPQTSPMDSSKSERTGRVGLVCTGSGDSCPVHGSDRQKSWSFFSDPVQVDQLIEGLNRRGIRERRLRQALSQEKETIVERLSSCPADKFNGVQPGSKLFTEVQNKSMKTYDQGSFLGYPRETPLETILESNLRDLILETEEKIFLGVVGGIKVKNRDAWREAIKNFSYDQQCKKLNWGSKNSDDSSEANNDVKDEPMDDEIKKELEEEESRASTPSLDEACPSAAWPGIQNVPQRQVIVDLASAILQLGQAIEYKYLKRPLGLDAKEREDKKICLIEPKFPTVSMGRWEEGLMSSTNLPQLFLYLTTLDNSVSWEKSALHASCRICRRKKDPESMLLCDTCNKGYHMYCLKPKLTKVPPGDWHCPKCQPKVKTVSPKKKRRLFSEGSDAEDENEENICKSCNEQGAQLGCGTCETWLHLACVNPPMRRVPKSKWFCHDCRNLNSQQNTSTSRKSEVKVEVKEEDEPMEVEEEEEQPKPEKPAAKSRGSTKNKEKTDEPPANGRRRESKEKPVAATPPPTKKMNGHVNGTSKYGDSESGEDETRGGDEGTPGTRSSKRERKSRTRRSEGPKGRDLPLDNAALQEILDVLMHDPDAPPFLRPVTKSEAPDYHEIIKKPMDFGTIKHKLNMLAYKRNSDLVSDAELLFNNCSLYNDESTDIYRAGEKLRKLFYDLCRQHNLIDVGLDGSGSPPAKRART